MAQRSCGVGRGGVSGCGVPPPSPPKAPRYLPEEGERLAAGVPRIPRMAAGDLAEGLVRALGDRRRLSGGHCPLSPPPSPNPGGHSLGGWEEGRAPQSMPGHPKGWGTPG